MVIATPDAPAPASTAVLMTVSDACAILDTYPDCSPPHVAPAEAHVVVNAMTLEWLRAAHGDAVTGGWLPPVGNGRVVVE